MRPHSRARNVAVALGCGCLMGWTVGIVAVYLWVGVGMLGGD